MLEKLKRFFKKHKGSTEPTLNYGNPPDLVLKLARLINPNADVNNGIVFTFGYDVYSAGPIPTDLWEHELTHVRQQTERGMDPIDWWNKYVEDPTFRLDQEVEAYRNQLKYVSRYTRDRNAPSKMKHQLAMLLSGPIYGNIISYQQAIKRLD